MAYCDLHRCGRNIIVIEGQELILGKQGDVAQIVLYRQEGILTVIDSGAMEADRQALKRAAIELGDFRKVVLINSHGHIDHVGNNNVIYELGCEDVEHFIPGSDYPNLCDQAGFFINLMTEASTYLKMGSPSEMVGRLMDLFPKPRTNRERVVKLEDRFALEKVTLSGVTFPACRVGRVLVIPSEGHTIGHVCFLLEDEGFYYGADEFIGAVAPWADSSPQRQMAACRLVIELVNAGVVKRAARGHHWGHVSGKDFAAALQQILDETELWDRHMDDLLRSGPYSAAEIVATMHARLPSLFGPNANPIFDTMKVLNTCHRMGASEYGEPPDTRFTLSTTSQRMV